MSLVAAVFHLANFFLPALVLAICMVLLGHLFFRPQAKAQGWLWPLTLHTSVGSAVLLLGLIWLGRDGKMLTYGALVLASASSQWLLLRAWR